MSRSSAISLPLLLSLKRFLVAMALIDSIAAFTKRVQEVIQEPAIRNAIQFAGIETFSALAFSVGTPQAPASDEAFRACADTTLPAHYGNAAYSGLRRLHFEATTLVVAQLKSSCYR